MTTNHPTAPMSAEAIAAHIDKTINSVITQTLDQMGFDCEMEKLVYGKKLIPVIEAYAARQTEPLAASVAVLVEALNRIAYCNWADVLGAGKNAENTAKQALTDLPAAAQAHLDEMTALKAENTRLRALLPYVQHKEDCSVRLFFECDCGLPDYA